MTDRVRGLDALLRTMQRITNSVPDDVQLRALMAGGEVVADEARKLVPVDSGELKASITVTDGTKLNFAKTSLSDGGMTVYIGPKEGGGFPDGFYGHMVEFGTINLPAQPFMRPAFDNTRGKVSTVIGEALWAPIERAARG